MMEFHPTLRSWVALLTRFEYYSSFVLWVKTTNLIYDKTIQIRVTPASPAHSTLQWWNLVEANWREFDARLRSEWEDWEGSGSSQYRRGSFHHFHDFPGSFHHSHGSLHYCHGSFGGSSRTLVQVSGAMECSTTYTDASATYTEDSMAVVELAWCIVQLVQASKEVLLESFTEVLETSVRIIRPPRK